MSASEALRPPAHPLSHGTSTAYFGNAEFHRCFCDLLDAAEREVVDFVIPEQRPDEHDRFILEAYGNAARRGIRCRTLISPEHLHLVQSTWDPKFRMRSFLAKFSHIRLIERVSGPFTVVDRKRVLLNLADPRDPAEYTTSVVVDDERMAEELIARFDALWAEAAGAQEGLVKRWEEQRERH